MKINFLPFLFSFFLFSVYFQAQAQVSINTDGSSPDPTAMLDVKSADKGVLVPRLNQAEIQQINAPADGLLVYNTDVNRFYFFDANSNLWQEMEISTNIIYPPFQNCGDMLVDYRDNQVYPTVDINGQCWMAKNLNYGTFYVGYQYDNGLIEKACYANNQSNCDIYGGLYQWREAMNYNYTQNTPGICPDGWYIPSDMEWFLMENFLDPAVSSPGQTGYRGSDIGGQLKETGTTHWNNPNSGATNSSGFTALGAGYGGNPGAYSHLNQLSHFWTSTYYNYPGGSSYARTQLYSNPLSWRGYENAGLFFSVRCAKYD